MGALPYGFEMPNILTGPLARLLGESGRAKALAAAKRRAHVVAANLRCLRTMYHGRALA